MLSIKSITGFSVSSSSSSYTNNPSLSTSTCSFSSPVYSVGSQRVSVDPLRIDAKESSLGKGGVVAVEKETKDAEHNGGTPAEEERRISGIHVPRQKYISVPKGELLDAVLALFESKEEAAEFARVARCLDAIFHAEHKEVLEEMRKFYLLTYHEEDKETIERSSVDMEDAGSTGNHMMLGDFNISGKGTTDSCRNVEDDKTMTFLNSLDLKSLFGSSSWLASSDVPVPESRVAFATSFQRSFMKLLCDAQFEELSARDLLLTYALNSDYLLTLPIYVDWKRASESNAIIFRRGYATERQKGLLLVEKLDYLQSKLLQHIFFSLSKPLQNIGAWLNEALKSSAGVSDLQIWIEKVKIWLKDQYFPESSLYFVENPSEGQLGSDQIADKELPIWIAAQKAVSRYEGLLSPLGPRGRLIRKLLTWTGLIPSLPEASITYDTETKYSEAYLRPNFLPRITLTNIWEPATRESCGNNVLEILKASFAIFFRRSTLQEPAFQELILLYTDEASQSKARDSSIDMLPLQLKIYERIPIPDLPVVFPHKKLSFRIIDTVRLDVASIIGLSAYLVNYKFLNIASSPSALFLDVIAVSALAIYLFRVVLGYKQTWDRYQLLVNKTLYEKTLASGFGSVHFLLDASEQQKYKEALLVYALLLSPGKYEVSCRKSIREACERFMYNKFKEKIEMPINSAMDTLLRLDLVVEIPVDGSIKVIALPCSKACEILKKRWNSLLEEKT